MEAVRVDDGRRLQGTYRSLSVHESRALLLYGLERRRPVQVVVGRSGTGKTRLLGALARIGAEGAELVLLRGLPTTLEETTSILSQRLGVPETLGEAPLERLARLADVLADRRRRGRLVGLLLDDAHLLPTEALLDLRLLAGTNADGGALLPIVLAGRPELAARLAEPALEPLRLAVATNIELLRPLPTTPEEDASPPLQPPRRWRRAVRAVSLAMAGLVVTAASLIVATSLPEVRRSLRSLSARGLQRSPGPALARPPRIALDPPPSARGAVPPTPTPVVRAAEPPPAAAPLTVARARAVVASLADALGARDVVALEQLFARDVRQNGVRGRTAILESYAYRFMRVDAPASIGPPGRVTLRDGSALVEAPFRTAYREADGTVGVVDGTVHVRVSRHAGHYVIDSLDWVYADTAG